MWHFPKSTFIFNRYFFVKALLYRVISAFTTAIIALVLTGDVSVSLKAGVLDVIVKILIYYLYDVAFERFAKKKIRPSVVWMTGLSGAGKTTIAREMHRILEKDGNKVVVLDGDEIRNMFPSTGFDEVSRKEHNRRVAYMAKLLKDQGAVVIVSLISPYRESRDDARTLCGEDFYEVYVCTDLDTCEGRDVKGLYAKARAGEIKNFTGIDSVYEVPIDADVMIDTAGTPNDCARIVIKKIR